MPISDPISNALILSLSLLDFGCWILRHIPCEKCEDITLSTPKQSLVFKRQYLITIGKISIAVVTNFSSLGIFSWALPSQLGWLRFPYLGFLLVVLLANLRLKYAKRPQNKSMRGEAQRLASLFIDEISQRPCFS
ncbi:TPA: hypothetical protein ACGOVM_001151 [Streptococcus suis]